MKNTKSEILRYGGGVWMKRCRTLRRARACCFESPERQEIVVNQITRRDRNMHRQRVCWRVTTSRRVTIHARNGLPDVLERPSAPRRGRR